MSVRPLTRPIAGVWVGERADLLARAVGRAAPIIADATKPTKERIRFLWAAVKAARGLAASDVLHRHFGSRQV